MADLEWAHAIAALLGAVGGAAGGIFAGGWRLGRIEGRLKLSFQAHINESEKRIEDKVEQARDAFDETLKALRQKINDVELGTERNFVPKNDFEDFRKEYREDMRDIKASIAAIPITRGRQ